VRLLFTTFVVLLVLPVSTTAQTKDLTEAEFLAPLGSDHPVFLALAGELGRARAAVVSARTLDDPDLSALRQEAGGADELELTLSWQPPHPRRRRLAVAAAEGEVAAAAARFEDELLGVELALREVYAGWAVATARADGLAAHLARVEELALRQRRRAEAGEASGLDARRLDLAVVELRASLAHAEAEAATAEAAARAWRPELSGALRPELPPLPELPPPELPPLPELAEAPPGTHPRIAALEAELAAARSSAELARRVLAMPEVVGGWHREEAGGGSADGPIVGLVWPVPLFDRNRAERLAAEARVDVLSARLELARRQLAGEREGRRSAYLRLREAALEAGAAAATGAVAVEAASAAFRLGEADLTDLLDTLRSATGAELAALELREAALAASRELARVSAPVAPTPIMPLDHHDLSGGALR
jgi:outer membrane protein TolC